LIDPSGKLSPPGWEKLRWQSARELFADEPFFVFNGINPQDIKQQAIADCYLLGAIATLATQPGLVRRLFDIEEANEYGVYAIWLNINGTWREFVVDDYFPIVSPGRLAFVKPTQNQREIWVMLLEKAYAKAYGGYYKLNLGRAGEALRDLTGAPSYGYTMAECRVDPERRAKVWKKVVSAFQNKYLVCASSLHTGTGTENRLKNGILTDHVYSILDMQDIYDSSGMPAKIL
jgi:calpain-15